MSSAGSAPPDDAQPIVPSGPKWYRLGIGDLVLVVLAIGIGQTATRGIIGDPGLGWHIRTPDVVLESGFPTADPFSGPKHGNHWLANQWLGDVPLWLGWKAAGLNGVIAVTMAFLLFGYRLLYGFLRADGASWPAAAIWTIFAAMASYTAWMARPNLSTFIAVMVVARALVLHNEGRVSGRRMFWLAPLFMIWANCHGGFIVGLVMIGLAGGVELALWLAHSDSGEREAAKRRFCVLAAVGVACFVATLVNPYGWKLYPWIFSLLGDDYFMNLNQEWLSPDFHAPGTIRIAAFILLFPAVFAVSRYRPRLTILILALFWLYLGLKGQRYTPLFIAISTPLLARASAHIDWLNDRVARLKQDEFFRVRSGGWLGTGIVIIAMTAWTVMQKPLDHDRSIHPCNGLRELMRLHQPGEVVLNSPNYGGFLTWHAWPNLPVWIDDRNEVYGREWYERYFELEGTKPGWEKTLAEWNPHWVAIPSDRPLTYRLAERGNEWELVYADKLVTLFRKR